MSAKNHYYVSAPGLHCGPGGLPAHLRGSGYAAVCWLNKFHAPFRGEAMGSLAMQDIDVLKRARALIADSRCWTKSTFARNALGEPVPSKHPTACKWCGGGAIKAISTSDCAERDGCRRHLEAALSSQWANRTFAQFNDAPETTHADVLACYDRAIANLSV